MSFLSTCSILNVLSPANRRNQCTALASERGAGKRNASDRNAIACWLLGNRANSTHKCQSDFTRRLIAHHRSLAEADLMRPIGTIRALVDKPRPALVGRSRLIQLRCAQILDPREIPSNSHY